MITRFKVVTLLLPLLALSILFIQNADAAARISGESRYATAVEIAQEGWQSSETVVLARGNDFPDALAGGPLAYHFDAPILLTARDSLTSVTRSEINRLQAKRVIILGGTSAISKSVEDTLKSMGVEVERIGGKNRYDTAARIAKKLPATKAVVASGQNFPDALAVAPYAARNGLPILLTSKESLPAETKTALTGKTSTIVVGGTGVVSNQVVNQLPSAKRYSGTDRYGTAKEIITKLPLAGGRAYVATGTNFADALAGSVLAAKRNAPIVLTNSTNVPNVVRQTISESNITSLTVFGGTAAVNEATSNLLSSIGLIDGDINKVSSQEWDVFLKVNEERVKANLKPLRLSVDLSAVARVKSKDMHDVNYFDHQSPTYGSPFEMMDDFGITYRRAAENIAAGYTSASAVMEGWMNSPGHRANIMNKDLTHIGVGYYKGTNNYREYWTQMFITP
ncbi:cell wall-binding repeat-containing protein [Bacillus suaedae]|uniref:Cell wall-binding repeat-containing protein n=1 Tax=Halalkalibacter suaedae TaxID=2822140 RepID=A0A941ASX7_9BACI|nr:cell wall-binding repeat-containing protein [Bacillus suaedae]MBP3950219.1 cell wall-binding repeat-containing protein [Bacillus suaedae]